MYDILYLLRHNCATATHTYQMYYIKYNYNNIIIKMSNANQQRKYEMFAILKVHPLQHLRHWKYENQAWKIRKQ